MRRAFLFLSVLTLAAAQCADNSLSLDLNDTICYSFHSKLTKFFDAQKHCKSFGAQLVSLKSEYINVFVTGFASNIFDNIVFIWSGGNNLQNSNKFVWSEGEELEYTHFPKENNTKNGSCISAEINQGFWKVDNCFAEFSFVCEFLAGKGIIPTEAEPLNLPPHNATTEIPPAPTATHNPDPEETTEFQSTPITSASPSEATTKTTMTESSTATSTEPLSTTTTTTAPTSTLNPDSSTPPLPTEITTEVATSPLTESTITLESTTSKTNIPPETESTTTQEPLPTETPTITFPPETESTTTQEPLPTETPTITFPPETESTTTQEPLPTETPKITFPPETESPTTEEPPLTETTTITFPPETESPTTEEPPLTETTTITAPPETESPTTEEPPPTETTTSRVTESTTPQAILSCPTDYILYQKNCYKFDLEPKSWDDAESECKNEGGHLASIHSKEENSYILTTFLNLATISKDGNCEFINQNNQVWIGYSNVSHPYAWSDNSVPDYVNWCSRQPDNLHKNESCGAIVLDDSCIHGCGQKWNDFACEKKLKYICKQAASSSDSSTHPTGKETTEIATSPLPEFTTTQESTTSETNVPPETESTTTEEPPQTETPTITAPPVTESTTPQEPPQTETPTITETESTTSQTSLYCPSGYILYQKNCYEFDLEPKSWNDAETYCQNDGGHLASIHSEEENNFIITTFLNLATITESNDCDYHDHNSQVWIGYTNLSHPYAWSDNSVSDYVNWCYREPNNFNKAESCGAIVLDDNECIHGCLKQWNDYPCEEKLKYVCKQAARSQDSTTPPTTVETSPSTESTTIQETTTVTPPPETESTTTEEPLPTETPTIAITESTTPQTTFYCPSGYILHQENCYEFNLDQKSWNDAESECNTEGGHLASIHSPEENTFIITKLLNLVTITESKDCDFHDHNSQVWIGYTNLSHPYAWSDNSVSDYISWCYREPNNFNKAESCGAIVLDDSECIRGCEKQWNDYPCGEKLKYVCKQAASLLVATETTPSPPPSCPDSWSYFNITGFCYAFFEQMTWQDAENKCIENGAHLTSIHSYVEAAFVGVLANPFSNSPDWRSQPWIGLYTNDNNANYKWSDRTPVDYIKWGSIQPDNPGFENCGQIWSGDSFYGFNNNNCEKTFNFICKKLPKKE